MIKSVYGTDIDASAVEFDMEDIRNVVDEKANQL